jgi:exopolysaccharide biosynthesis polyprenyl glycosylphosphotransferase
VFQERARSFQGVFLFLDAVCIAAAFGLGFLLRFHHERIPLLGKIPQIPWVGYSRSDYALLFLTVLLVWLATLRRSRLYLGTAFEHVERVVAVYLKALLLCVLATGAMVFLLKISPSRLLFGYFFGSAFVLLVGKHLLMTAVLRRLRSSLWHRRHALVIGAERPARWFAEVIREARGKGYELAGIVVTDGAAASSSDAPPVVGTLDDLDRVLAERPVEEVFLVGSAREMAELAPVAQQLVEKGRIVSLVSTVSSGANGVLGRITDFDGVPMLSYGPMPRDEVRASLKRFVDVGLAGLALVLLGPLMLAVAVLIRLGGPGPVLFRQERLGLGGRRFALYKFRTMKIDAERLLRADPDLYRRYVANDYKLPEHEDPRVTRLGSLLRRSSIDELPQLWNVVRGDMTLVGPRPIVPDEIREYEPYADLFLSVRPGLTGHWQISGRSLISYPERAFLDLDYVARHSLRADLSIIVRTVPAVLRRKGAI